MGERLGDGDDGPGESRLVTTTGDRVDAGVYVDRFTGEILRSADPKAP